jgi:hypothetical protein
MPSLRSGINADLEGSQLPFRRIPRRELGFVDFWPLALYSESAFGNFIHKDIYVQTPAP